MKKSFSNAAEELITGIPSVADEGSFTETEAGNEKSNASAGAGYMRYVEPRSERMNLLLSRSLVKKLEAEAKARSMSKNGLVNEILEAYFEKM